METENRDLSTRELRRFALVTGGLFAVIFGVLLPWLWGLAWPRWPWALCAVLVVWGLAHPASLKPVHAGWMKVAEAIGRVNNRLVLGLVFFALITPIGWIRRQFGGDPMARRFDASADTYRKPKNRRPPPSLERPF